MIVCFKFFLKAKKKALEISLVRAPYLPLTFESVLSDLKDLMGASTKSFTI